METGYAIALIVGLLITGISVSGYFQMREKLKSELRQKINQFLFRIRQANDFYDQFSGYNIGKSTRSVLLHYIEKNLASIEQLDPGFAELQTRKAEIKQRLEQLATAAEPGDSGIPKQPEQIVQLMNQFKKLMQYIKKLGGLSSISTKQARASLQHLMSSYRYMQVVTFIEVAKQSYDEGKTALARQYLGNAKKALVTQSDNVERMQSLTQELQILESKLMSKAAEAKSELETEIAEQEQEEQENDLFQPKKKW